MPPCTGAGCCTGWGGPAVPRHLPQARAWAACRRFTQCKPRMALWQLNVRPVWPLTPPCLPLLTGQFKARPRMQLCGTPHHHNPIPSHLTPPQTPLHPPHPSLRCPRVMAEVMLEEIGRRPGAASKEEEEAGQAGAGGLHKVGRWAQHFCLMTSPAPGCRRARLCGRPPLMAARARGPLAPPPSGPACCALGAARRA